MAAPRLALLMLLAGAASAFDFTNPKLTACAVANRVNGVPWLTRNNASYICTDAQFDTYYDPATAIAYTSMNPGDGPTHLACPVATQTVRCFVFASWGQVAGGPDSCADACSTEARAGAASCCGKACVGDPTGDATCHGNAWHPAPGPGECGASGTGWCDCCPDCYDCVHPPPSNASLVDNRFCDCRRGLEVSPDYSPCWNSRVRRRARARPSFPRKGARAPQVPRLPRRRRRRRVASPAPFFFFF